MSLPYLARLVCLCFAAFFLAHTLAALATSLVARWAVGRVDQLSPKVAATLLFALRMLPAAVGALFVGGLCAPSYLLFEPRATSEQLGPACLVAAALGGTVCLSGLWRGVLSARRSSRYLRIRSGNTMPLFALAGIFRPKLIVSPAVREALTIDEFDAAVRHEEAHRRAKDNLKRLLILLSPDIFPGVRGFRTLDATWKRLAEWAADDFAAGGSPDRALNLASALVRVGRFQSSALTLPLGTSLLADGNDLRARVDRLTDFQTDYRPLPRILAIAAGSVALAGIAMAPALLRIVHRAMEALAQ